MVFLKSVQKSINRSNQLIRGRFFFEKFSARLFLFTGLKNFPRISLILIDLTITNLNRSKIYRINRIAFLAHNLVLHVHAPVSVSHGFWIHTRRSFRFVFQQIPPRLCFRAPNTRVLRSCTMKESLYRTLCLRSLRFSRKWGTSNVRMSCILRGRSSCRICESDPCRFR